MSCGSQAVAAKHSSTGTQKRAYLRGAKMLIWVYEGQCKSTTWYVILAKIPALKFFLGMLHPLLVTHGLHLVALGELLLREDTLLIGHPIKAITLRSRTLGSTLCDVLVQHFPEKFGAGCLLVEGRNVATLLRIPLASLCVLLVVHTEPGFAIAFLIAQQASGHIHRALADEHFRILGFLPFWDLAFLRDHGDCGNPEYQRGPLFSAQMFRFLLTSRVQKLL